MGIKRLFQNGNCFLMLLVGLMFLHFSPPPTASSFLSFQDENAAAQGVLAVHGGPVRHLLPPLLQGPPLRLPAARALRPIPQHQVLHHGHWLLLEGEGCGHHPAQPCFP